MYLHADRYYCRDCAPLGALFCGIEIHDHPRFCSRCDKPLYHKLGKGGIDWLIFNVVYGSKEEVLRVKEWLKLNPVDISFADVIEARLSEED